jgi:flagellar biosynthesis protein FlhF
MTTPKTFRGRSLQEAHNAAIAEFGAGAVVVATRKLSKQGVLSLFQGEEYEVVATPKPAPVAASPDTRARPIDAFIARPPSPFAEAARLEPGTLSEMDSIRVEVRNEVRALRSMIARTQVAQSSSEDRALEATRRELEAELAELAELIGDLRSEHERDIPAQLKRLLASAGIEGNTARMLARRVRERGDGRAVPESFRAALLESLRVGAWPLESRERSLVALVGPTGVGKTTTAAKLAAHARLDLGKSVALIGCDGFRVGAVEQLERFGALLGADVRFAKNRHGLEEAIASTKADVIIVDTAGRGPAERDGVESSLPRVRVGKGESIAHKHVMLCVPAALREVDAKAIGRFFQACGPTGIIVTKLDETTAPSGLLHAPFATKLPLSAVCFGQRVPEDIAAASHKIVLDAICPAPSKRPARSAA